MARRELGPSAQAVARALDPLWRPSSQGQAGSPLVLGVSGGADSLALAGAAAWQQRRAERTGAPSVLVQAVIVDHQLQQGSAQVAEQARAQVESLGLPARVVRVEVDADGAGPEASARTARRAALAQVARELDACVVLAHSLDDQAETVLLRLARGSGVRTLAAMRPCVEADQVRWLRPLLGLRRRELAQATQEFGLIPWADPHNLDPSFARVRVRERVLPTLEAELGSGVALNLARTAELAAVDADLLDQLAGDLAGRLVAGDHLAVDGWPLHPPALRSRVLHQWLAGLGVPVDLSLIEAVEAGIQDWRTGRRLDLPGGTLHWVRPAPDGVRELWWLPSGLGTWPGQTTRVDDVRASDITDDLARVLHTREEIDQRIAELAAEIDQAYQGRDLLLVGVLNGAVMVMADLSRAMTQHVQMDWMAISSYGSGVTSSGVVRILKDLSVDIAGRDVVIVEDIVDTGLTLSYLVQNLASRNPASLEIMTMFRKPEAANSDVEVKWVGFDLPNEFVVGYGLDYAGRYRNLQDVGTLAEHVYR